VDWAAFGKRLVIALGICIPLAAIGSVIVFHIWSLATFALSLLFIGIILLIFGGCLRTSFVEGLATYRYAANPPVTRDTMHHFSDRRQEQTDSSIVVLTAAAILVALSIVCFATMPFLPI
jgi:hypothetical protein